MSMAWPADQLQEIERFYCLGLKKASQFQGHQGYDGVLFGLPGFAYHLEFTQHEAGSPCPTPTKENLLVLYIPDAKAIERVTLRLEQLGYSAVAPENPYWKEKGAITVKDPDG